MSTAAKRSILSHLPTELLTSIIYEWIGSLSTLVSLDTAVSNKEIRCHLLDAMKDVENSPFISLKCKLNYEYVGHFDNLIMWINQRSLKVSSFLVTYMLSTSLDDTSFPAEFCNVTDLCLIFGCKNSVIDLSTLLNERLPNLERLTIKGNSLHSHILEHNNTVIHECKLKMLSLTSFELDPNEDPPWMVYVWIARCCPLLETLVLHRCNAFPLSIITETLSLLPHLHTFSFHPIHEDDTYDEDTLALEEYHYDPTITLSQDFPSIHCLHLQIPSTSMSMRLMLLDGMSITNQFFALLPCFSSLRCLHLDGIFLDPSSVIRWQEWMQHHGHTLEELLLRGNLAASTNASYCFLALLSRYAVSLRSLTLLQYSKPFQLDYLLHPAAAHAQTLCTLVLSELPELTCQDIYRLCAPYLTPAGEKTFGAGSALQSLTIEHCSRLRLAAFYHILFTFTYLQELHFVLVGRNCDAAGASQQPPSSSNMMNMEVAVEQENNEPAAEEHVEEEHEDEGEEQEEEQDDNESAVEDEEEDENEEEEDDEEEDEEEISMIRMYNVMEFLSVLFSHPMMQQVERFTFRIMAEKKHDDNDSNTEDEEEAETAEEREETQGTTHQEETDSAYYLLIPHPSALESMVNEWIFFWPQLRSLDFAVMMQGMDTVILSIFIHRIFQFCPHLEYLHLLFMKGMGNKKLEYRSKGQIDKMRRLIMSLR